VVAASGNTAANITTGVGAAAFSKPRSASTGRPTTLGSGVSKVSTALAAVDRIRDATDCLVAVLDSCGTIKFTVFSFYTHNERSGEIWRSAVPIARSVTTKVPAANASGVSNCLVVLDSALLCTHYGSVVCSEIT
jgi:hypothetical protein